LHLVDHSLRSVACNSERHFCQPVVYGAGRMSGAL
jgi:hypothetical protein